jgi:hypothetical protein
MALSGPRAPQHGEQELAAAYPVPVTGDAIPPPLRRASQPGQSCLSLRSWPSLYVCPTWRDRHHGQEAGRTNDVDTDQCRRTIKIT